MVAELAKIFTSEVPLIPLFFITQTGARVAGLQGTLETTPGESSSSNFFSNVYEWEF